MPEKVQWLKATTGELGAEKSVVGSMFRAIHHAQHHPALSDTRVLNLNKFSSEGTKPLNKQTENQPVSFLQ